MTRKLSIGLLWHTYGHPNLGVDALTRANISILRSACERADVDPEFTLLGTKLTDQAGERDVKRGPGPSLKQLAIGYGPFVSALDACDIVFDTSEGDSFTDIYGAKRCILQSISKLRAAQKGPLVLSPQTIGPFNSSWSMALARSVLKKAEKTFARDHLSTQELSRLGMLKRADEVIDVAFRLPFEGGARLASDKISVGVNVSGLMYLAASRFQMSIDYPRFIRTILTNLSARDDVEIWLVPHVLAEGHEDDDAAVNRLLQEEFPKTHLAPTFRSSVEAKSFISRLDFFTGARMHACIAAYSSGVPVVPVAYSRKFNGLFESLNYSRFIDGRASDNESALAIFDKAFGELPVVKGEVNRGLAIAQQKLEKYEDVLVDILRKVRA